MVNRLTYALRLTPDAVRERIEGSVDRPEARYWIAPGTTTGRPVIGRVKGNKFWWRMRHRERASFAPWLSGQIQPARPGSLVLVEVHSAVSRKVIVVAVVSAVLLLFTWSLTVATTDAFALVEAAAAILLILAFVAAGTALYSGERTALRRAFEDTFSDVIDRGPAAGLAKGP